MGEAKHHHSLMRTQKAKGIAALGVHYEHTLGFSAYDAADVIPGSLVGKFCRPCPMRPRHGFVDSRFVSTYEEAQTLIAETLAADAEAEIVVMERINAPFSGIWTKGYLAIGPGTDGATAGHSAKTVPAIGSLVDSGLLELADIKTAPYVEILWKKYGYGQRDATAFEHLAVQLRDGPLLETATDFIPAPVTVSEVLDATGDLLDWESKMKTVQPGTVVYHENGTMASHYAIHAVLNKVPLLISRRPVVGERLIPSSAPKPEPDVKAAKIGFALALSDTLAMPDAGHFMLAGCHHTTAWLGTHDLLLGYAMGCAWRLTVTACMGEVRYLRKKTGDRDAVYSNVWAKTDTAYARFRFAQTINRFLHAHWPSSNVGGESWAKIAIMAAEMYNHLTRGKLTEALESLNALVNSEHNNGWTFNKFLQRTAFDSAASDPIWALVRVGPTVYQTLSRTEEEYAIALGTFKKRRVINLEKAKKNPNAADPENNVNSATPPYRVDGKIVAAQAKINGQTLHVQYKVADTPGYQTVNFSSDNWTKTTWAAIVADHDISNPSFATNSAQTYYKLRPGPNKWFFGPPCTKILQGKG